MRAMLKSLRRFFGLSAKVFPAKHTAHVVEEEEAEAEAELAGLAAEEAQEGGRSDGRSDGAGSAQEKDSGISRTTDSDGDLPPPLRSPSTPSSGHGHSPAARSPALPLHPHLDPPTTDDGLTPTEATLGASQLPSPLSDLAPHRPSATRDSDASLERELASLHREMETVRLECDRLIAQHANAEQKVREQMETAEELMATVDSLVRDKPSPQPTPSRRPGPAQHGAFLQQVYERMEAGSSSPAARHHRAHDGPASAASAASPSLRGRSAQGRSGQDTSSAYNTGGESCRSTPLNMRPEPREAGPYGGQAQGVVVPELSAVLRENPWASKRRPFGSYRGDRSTPVGDWPAKASVGCGEEAGPFRPGQLMSCRAEDVEATIALQQRLLRQAMLAQAHQLRSAHQLGQGPVPSPSSQHMEWKVKRRSDGSRYVTKRPVRNKLLRERAAQVSSERTGLSTDDDAFSELKVGRYWTREEKKRHVEKSKERKRRQEELQKKRQDAIAATEKNPIVYLANKKQMRRKPHQLFDKFTTVQEFLAHGSRAQDSHGPRMGILSVTTV